MFCLVLEIIMDGRIRRIVECEMGEEQQGFRRGRGTADGMFTLRQLAELDWRNRRMEPGIIRLGDSYISIRRVTLFRERRSWPR